MVEKLFMVTGTFSAMVMAIVLVSLLGILLASCLLCGWVGFAFNDAAKEIMLMTPPPF